MRILANENFPGSAVEALRKNGHEVVWIRTEAPGICDKEVLAMARADTRVLITFDKDFAELAFHARLPASCGIILFRIRCLSANHVANVAVKALASQAIWEGWFVVVENDRIRIRRLPGSQKR